MSSGLWTLLQDLSSSLSVQNASHTHHLSFDPRMPRKALQSRTQYSCSTVCSARRNRQASVALSESLPGHRSDLQTIPGIGPKNESLMIASGLDSVAKLKEVFVTQQREKTKMMTYLQSKVGVRNRAHARSIATHLHDQMQEVSQVPRPTQLTFCVEGNISVGKTTFLRRIAAECSDLQHVLDVVPEPVDKWQNVVGKTQSGEPTSFNLLDEFYRAPERYAYTFQNWVFYTRYKQEQESRHENSPSQHPLRLMERSVFSDRKVFVETGRESNWMNDMEMTVYDQWFDHVLDTNKQLIPNGFIYLQAEPDICHTRLHGRGRFEESSVSLDYLSTLHEKHENWFLPDGPKRLHLPGESLRPGEMLTPKGVIVPASAGRSSSLQLNTDITTVELAYKEPPACIRDRVVWMDSRMHHQITRVPALILDCNATIDMDRDTEAKQHYAQQLLAFFTYVREVTDSESLLGPQLSGPGLVTDRSTMEGVLRHVKQNLPDHLRARFLDELNKESVSESALESSPLVAVYNKLDAIVKHLKETGGDVGHVIQVHRQLESGTKTNKEKRYAMYSAIAKANGEKVRKQHPQAVEQAIRDMFPESNPKEYTGFIAA
eukprot:CAMPEP_0196589110 /NCGR_PEP_ID=MMETSP1081-20130531/62720_1 /TAXON_ID=36882 /ORGANISM="Pyramimonas amylifera, Strain CCMP720" /LENGTH=602 /DNA_ID=CAMNT_0041911827 /DNA_START=159 /DNA_END=1967 /DNA_ORIENTATION=+